LTGLIILHSQQFTLSSVTGVSMADTVTQPKSHLFMKEGEFALLDCEYESTDASPYLFWYVQHPEKTPQLILKNLGFEERVTSGTRFSATLNKKDRQNPLEISDVTVSDSGLYFCALSATMRQNAQDAMQEQML
uniref:Ig-like domain-containing protein n=1 Tax=Leptobrachium leishanense TaxID=445787 RepID=A0A8C5M8G8_9ANUR